MPPSDDPFDRATVTPSQEVFAPRVLPGPKRAIEREPASLAPGIAQGGGIGAWPRLWSSETLTVTGSVSGTAALFAMSNNQFAPPPALLPAGIKIDPTWGEFFVEAGLTAKYAIAPRLSAYGGVSYLESATRGHDDSTNGNTYHGLAELAYGGVTLSGDVGVDLSYGQQEFTVGNGMLLWSGATNGTQRGADYLGPRGAWANAAVAKVTWREMTVTAFWLKPNEAQALDTGTRIWGVNADWMPSGPLRAGFMYVHVPRSQIVTRDGLDVYDARLRWHPFFASPEFWLQGEYAWQRNVSVAASGGYVQANYNGQQFTWKPALAVQWTWLSGDKPQSSQWEGFDPLYFGNSNPNWYQGKLGSTLFNNTNLVTASATLTLNPTDKQIVQLWYLDFRTAVANAPLDIPPPHMPVPVGGGVPAKALAKEVDASWTYQFDKALNVTVIAAYAAPGSGYKELFASYGGAAAGWWLLGAQFNVSY